LLNKVKKQIYMRILLAGFGTVGQGFVEILRDKQAASPGAYDDIQIAGVATGSRGRLYHPAGLNLDDLLRISGTGDDTLADYPADTDLQRNWHSTEAFIRECAADVVIEATPSNLETGQPAIAHCEAALETGKHLVLANKGPVVLAFQALQALADEQNLAFRYEATVLAGTPAIATVTELLDDANVRAIRGIFNGTTNFMLSEMENGLSYEGALAKAQELGYAESDPSADVEGWDAAAKVVILMASVYGQSVALSDVDVQGITGITAQDITDAQQADERYRLVAMLDAAGGSVVLQRLMVDDPLYNIQGATNAIVFQTDLLGDVTLTGAGAGRIETGYGLWLDILFLKRRQML
jgi:homoserine dehydrogenase